MKVTSSQHPHSSQQQPLRQPHSLFIAPVHCQQPASTPGVRELFQAAAQGRHADVGHLLRLTGSRYFQHPDDGRTPLMAALLADDPVARARTFDLLASSGASLSGRDAVFGRDLIGWAAALGRHAELEKALRLSADSPGPPQPDWRRRDAQGQTCLHLAVASGCSQTVAALLRVMLRQRASVEHLNSQGQTPYMLARRLGLAEIAELLRQRQRLDDAEVERAERRRARQQRQVRQPQLRFANAAPPPQRPAGQPAKPTILPPILPLNRGETYAEMLIKAIGGVGCRTSQQLLHSALDLWSEQHFPSYRRGVTAGAAAAAEVAAQEVEAEAAAMRRRGRRLPAQTGGRRLDSRLR